MYMYQILHVGVHTMYATLESIDLALHSFEVKKHTLNIQ